MLVAGSAVFKGGTEAAYRANIEAIRVAAADGAQGKLASEEGHAWRAVAPVCDFGWQAVDATLPGVDGKEHSIFDQPGPNGLVVAFICNHCPYVKAVIGAHRARRRRTLASRRRLRGDQLQRCGKPPGRFVRQHEAVRQNATVSASPICYDEDQSVARAYGAVCTPDFFGFNGNLQLQYRGRLDASRKEAGVRGLRRDLFEAMVEVAASGAGPRDQIASIGCSIKWKD